MTDQDADAAWRRRYFEDFLPKLMNQLLLPDLASLTACFEIHVTGSNDPQWRLAVEEGRLVHVGAGGPEPHCRYTVDPATFRTIVRAEETPQQAFFDMRISLDGDMEMGLKLSTVLEPFFARYAYAG